MVESLKVGDAVAEPGCKAVGYWDAFKRTDGVAEKIPVFLANGAKSGPTVWVSGCHHGDELDGMFGALKFFEQLNPGKMSGSVICVPISNPSAFWEKARCSPHDNLDLERVFPGSPEGDYTERLAYSIHQKVISKAEYLIDLHGGGDSKIIDFAVFDYSNAKTKDANREIAFACDFDYAFGIPKPILGGGLQTFHASAAGIPSIGLESNDPEVQSRNIMRILVHLGMLGGKIVRKEKIRIKSLHVLRCKHNGILISSVDRYEKVSKDQVIGKVVNLIGEQLEEIRSPIDGMVMTVRTDPIVKSTWNTRLVGLTWEKAMIFELAGLGTKKDW